MFEFLNKNADQFKKSLIYEGNKWHFSPASSPHFNGLAEAGVKSTKFHLKRVLGYALLTYEEYLTVIVEIECLLNSRPLYPLSSSPNDYQVLTPSHFLIGRRLTAIPNTDFVEIPTNRLSRWQYLSKLQQQFWNRWSRDYLGDLQIRTKWNIAQDNVKPGTIVLIKENNTPPAHWKIGRVIEVHPGDDNIIRVATIKTKSGLYKRAVRTKSLLTKYEMN
ncbi:hypothetical protein PPYR_07609 [Photinus pyralis]|uniref:DUF5641 domain-containing protein n=1 Tax=Photinus pyralis TaxID=7054 RepID=A0A5N4AQZ1_PHOPY|nr:hypothetical protein PPYR_07609 [Photinus pyralis]